jgi:hypothetical protein
MMQLARRVSLLVALFLLASATTARAECAWVLWFTSGRTTTNTSPTEAFATKKECEQAMARDARKIAEYKRNYPEDFAYNTCLPDTVDPRGPKGK